MSKTGISPDRVEYWLGLNEAEVIEMNGDDTRRTAPVFRYAAALELADFERLGGARTGFDILACVRKCANLDFVMPDWLAREFIRRYDAVLNVRALSWDAPEAFGRPYKKGTNQAATRKRRLLRFGISNSVRAILAAEPSTPIDEALFERVGKQFNIGKTLAAELHYSAEKLLPRTSRKLRKYTPAR